MCFINLVGLALDYSTPEAIDFAFAAFIFHDGMICIALAALAEFYHYYTPSFVKYFSFTAVISDCIGNISEYSAGES